MSAIGLAVSGVGLAGCGQRGPLYLPTDPAAANRATLPQVLLPMPSRSSSESTTQPPAQDDKPAGGETTNQNTQTNTPR